MSPLLSRATAFSVAALLSGCTGSIDGLEHETPEAATPRSRPPQTEPVPDSPAAACKPGVLPPGPRLVRLTRLQYDNTLRDLTGLDLRSTAELPVDPDHAGYNRSLDLEVGELHGRVYRSEAESVAQRLAASPEALRGLTGCDVVARGMACAPGFVADFGRRAFRRPLTDAEQRRYLDAFMVADTLVPEGDAFAKGVRVTVEAMLQSPHFLYRVEKGDRTLTSHEIAARLSYRLVNSMPDAALRAAADRDELRRPEALVQQARRLLATDAGRATLMDFHGQWLSIDSWADHLSKDQQKYPGVTAALAPVLQEETRRFVEAVIYDEKEGLAGLLTSPFSFVNAATARLYGVEGRFGEALERTALDPTRRAGVLTQIGFLAAHAGPTTSSPILRGAFVQKRLLCTPIPDPAVEVPDVPPPPPGKTTRETVEEHTSPAACAGCHALLNRPGFGLENFDAVGQWRSTEDGRPIDASGRLVGTEKALTFDGPTSLARAIVESPESRACYARHVFRYTLGREETEGDACALDAITASLAGASYTAVDLLVDMVRTDAFLHSQTEGL